MGLRKGQPAGWLFSFCRGGLQPINRFATKRPCPMRSYRFTHAITRLPPASAIHGLRAVDTGAPDLAVMRAHHVDYVVALKSTGATVVELPADEAYPDSLFVEDTALCLQEGAVVMRPGAPSRLGEAAEMAPHLRALYGDVREVTGAANYIEAGDILTTETEILVGRSARTNAGGVAELTRLVADWGYSVREVFTPPGVLHFKTDCSLLDDTTILATERLDASGCFTGYKVIHTAPGEEASANAIRFNDLVLFPAGFPRTRDALLAAGYNVREIGNSECAKLDGGMSCLSLRFTPKP
jgi:dimethylargininase